MTDASDETLPERTLLGPVADDAFDRIAELVRRVVDVPVALVSLVDRTQQVFPGAAGLPRPLSLARCTPLDRSFCQHVVRSARPLVVEDVRDNALLRDNPAVTELPVGAYAGVPLTDAEGVTVGSLCAIDTEPRAWAPSEIAVLTDLAAACSSELRLRIAAADADRMHTRSAALLTLSQTLARTETIEDVARVVSALVISQLGAYFGGVSMIDPGGRTMTYVDISVLPGEVQDSYRTSSMARETPSAAVGRTGTAFYFETLGEMRARFPAAAADIAPSGGRASAFEPLMVGGRTVGALSLLWAYDREFDADDRALVAALARYTAQAVSRAQLLADRREVAETLQAAMLPSLPALSWVELAGRYLPARATATVGGDWYDAFERADGELALSVGDVEGHDTIAAGVMGQIRSTLRGIAYAMPGSPAAVLTTLDDLLQALPPRRYATCVLATVTPMRDGTGCRISWSNAAHLPPLLLTPHEPPRFLDADPQLPVGMPYRGERRAHAFVPDRGSTLLLFTDGLVERPGRDADTSLAGLAEAADRHRDLPLGDLLDAVLGELADPARADDVVLFGLRLP